MTPTTMTTISTVTEIRIPGTFVVLQGLAGDGLANTIDSFPELIIEDGEGDINNNNNNNHNEDIDNYDQAEESADPMHFNRHAEAANAHHDLRRPHSLPAPVFPLNVIGSSLQTAGRFPSTNRTRTTTTSTPATTTTTAAAAAAAASPPHWVPNARPTTAPAAVTMEEPLEDSFIVVRDDDEDDEEEQLLRRLPEPVSQNMAVQVIPLATLEEQHHQQPRRRQRPRRPRPQRQRRESSSSSAAAAAATPRLSRAQQLAVDDWEDQCWRTQCEQYAEWQENCHANSRNFTPSMPARHNLTAANHNTTSTSSGLMSMSSSMSSLSSIWSCGFDSAMQALQNKWWLAERGQVALLDRLPERNQPLPNIVGVLPPGSAVTATALYTFHSEDLTPLAVEPAEVLGAVDIFPSGRQGWMQILRVEQQQQPPVGRRSSNRKTSTAYVVLSHNGYAYLGPGLPANYVDPHCWIWRVTCPEGAYVREGLDLSTNHIATIPYGSLLQVQRKTVNAMGLSRVQIVGQVSLPTLADSSIAEDYDSGARITTGWHSHYIEGWCSEFLNPLSGQRGTIVQPLPFCVPALYRVQIPAVIRSGLELSSPELGHAPPGALVSVVGRAFSEHPADRCLERLRLAAGGGWISWRLNQLPPRDLPIVSYAALDPSFDPQQPALFHLAAQENMRKSLTGTSTATTTGIEPSVPRRWPLLMSSSSTTPPTAATISSVEDDDDDFSSSSSSCSSEDEDDAEPSFTAQRRAPPRVLAEIAMAPGCTYTRTPSSLVRSSGTSSSSVSSAISGALLRRDQSGNSAAANAIRSSCASTTGTCSTSGGGAAGADATAEFCLICLTEERTATLVHGSTGHIACCLVCARILKARGDPCPVCRLPIDVVIQHFWA